MPRFSTRPVSPGPNLALQQHLAELEREKAEADEAMRRWSQRLARSTNFREDADRQHMSADQCQSLLEYLAAHPRAIRRDIAAHLGVNVYTMLNWVAEAERDGLITVDRDVRPPHFTVVQPDAIGA